MNPREIAIRATRISGMQKLEELHALVAFLWDKPPDRIVELGTARGGTLYAFCQVATAYAKIVSVDLDHSDEERLRGYAQSHQSLHLVTGDSRNVRRQVEDLVIYADLLHIDADHSEASVRADWNEYHEIVRPGGYVVLHDISDGGGIGQLFSELAASYWTIQFVEANGLDGWGGIGVVRV